MTAARRKANSEASRRFRDERHLIPLPEDMKVGVLDMREHKDTYLVCPSNEILDQCQRLFGSGKSEFEPQQVFIVMKMMPRTDGDFSNELDFLLRIMQTRLCSDGIYDTDEGHLIRLAIAFSRRISLQEVPLPHTVKNEGYLVDIQGVIPGIWEIKVRFPSPGYVTPVRGSVAKLIQHITYINSNPPSTKSATWER
ncbi:hypothetical protein N7532_001407 [Penicillium argentinense]|uniref:Uncharacterized protein n=1 Tax=Penicillium argentinense TaxID=1131581 RepID=A0A9W9G403_9EURO|nr:uncharacterized protein N7532_001407 [Penicillium argentinense]KAJ5110872.1 hypothetical protein N7532_001407 [Penicillium argentinense]